MCYPDGDGENAFPAILAYIESHVRIALNKAINAIGEDSFVQCDTDGLLASVSGLMRRARGETTRRVITTGHGDFLNLVVAGINTLTAPFELRVKRTYSRVEIIGPQHVRLDGKRRFSGIPGSGQDLDDGSIGAWTWPKLSLQMSSGTPEGYVRHYARYRVPRALAAGWITTTGHVRPVEWKVHADGTQTPLPFTQTRWHDIGEELAEVQTPDVLRLIREKGKV
jgi:hypothetical protein